MKIKNLIDSGIHTLYVVEENYKKKQMLDNKHTNSNSRKTQNEKFFRQFWYLDPKLRP